MAAFLRRTTISLGTGVAAATRMTINNISRVQTIQTESSIEADKAARDSMNGAMDREEKLMRDSYKDQQREISENKDAREKENKGAFFGTLFGGFIIGSLIGRAIGNGMGDGNKDAAREAKRQTGIDDLEFDKAKDRRDEARQELDDAREKQGDLRKFGEEIRDSRFVGIE